MDVGRCRRRRLCSTAFTRLVLLTEGRTVGTGGERSVVSVNEKKITVTDELIEYILSRTTINPPHVVVGWFLCIVSFMSSVTVLLVQSYCMFHYTNIRSSYYCSFAFEKIFKLLFIYIQYIFFCLVFGLFVLLLAYFYFTEMYTTAVTAPSAPFPPNPSFCTQTIQSYRKYATKCTLISKKRTTTNAILHSSIVHIYLLSRFCTRIQARRIH